MQCPYCGRDIPDDARWCPYCGGEQTPPEDDLQNEILPPEDQQDASAPPDDGNGEHFPSGWQDSAARRLTQADVANLTWEQCCLARNEIFARHGRIFQTPQIAAYFEAQSWYHGTVPGASFDNNSLSPTERANADFLANYENATWGHSYY